MIRLIAVDFDGTLLNNKSVMTDTTRQVLLNAKQAGIHLVACTGRHFYGTRPLDHDNLFDFYICGNGANVRTPEGKTVLFHPMKLETCKTLIDYSLHSGLTCNLYTNDMIISNTVNSVMRYYLELNKHTCICPLMMTRDLVTEAERFDSCLLKIEIRDIADEIRPLLKEELKKQADICCEGNFRTSVEIHAKGIDKGTGLMNVAAHLGINLKDTMAFGDAENDVPLIKTAGVGIAMENGVPELKKAAKIIAPNNNEDGVAVVIQAYLKGAE